MLETKNFPINFFKNELIDEVLTRYYQTFSVTLDTADYVPAVYNEKIKRYIFRNLKQTFRKINREDRKFQRELRRQRALEEKALKSSDGEPSLELTDVSELPLEEEPKNEQST